MKINDQKIKYIYFAVSFIILCIIIFCFKPLIRFDGDDWFYTGVIRTFLPSLREFNPIKVFPENLEGIVSFISAFTVNKLFNDIVFSMEILDTFVYVLFVVFYLYSFYVFIYKRTKNTIKALIYVSIFLFLHCIIVSSNSLLLPLTSVNLHYNYYIPSIFSMALVYVLISDNHSFSERFIECNLIKKILWLVGLYFVIFSNLYCSIIIVIYAFVYFIKNILIDKKRHLKDNVIEILIGILFLISLFFESHGIRASQMSSKTAFSFDTLYQSFVNFILLLKSQNIIFYLLFLLLIILNIWKHKKINICIYLPVILLNILYTIFLSAFVSVGYASNPINYFMAFSFLITIFILLIYNFTDILDNFKLKKLFVLIIPLVFILLFVFRNTKTYNYGLQDLTDKKKYEIMKEYTDKIITWANETNKLQFKMNVLYFNDGDNFPFPLYNINDNITLRIEYSLYKLGITKREIYITPIPNKDENRMWKIKK